MVIRSQYCYCFSGIITIYFSLLIHTLASPTPHFCRHDQRDALLEFKDEFPVEDPNQRQFKWRSLWNKSSDCCFWKGVTCDDKSGQVISLEIYDPFLNSSLKTNSSLFRLQYLRQLNLNGCNLQGKIPSSLGNLFRLTLVDLSDNEFIGEIPFSLGNLSHLLELRLSNNQLVGELPASIGNLKKLRVLSLDQNSLIGNIPISFVNLTKLSIFSLNSNNFTSTFPSDMSGLHNLEYFDAGANSFHGPFPKSLFSIPSLQTVSLEGNKITGPMEFVNISSSPNLQDLLLDHNKFDGPIPESISGFLNLNRLYLSHNNLTGSIPRSMSKLVNLLYLDLLNNKLEGEVPGFLWRLMTVRLSHNFFSSFENSSHEPLVQALDLNSNSFREPFPEWICKLPSPGFLDLSNNLFSGSIPPCLRNSIAFLTQLILRNNNFSGTFPDIFANATDLQSLDISHNQLEGNLPRSLINCKVLQLVNVENNKIKDKFPSWLGSLPSLHVLILSSNKFYGPLYHPQMSIGFRSLRIIDISHNGFTGTLPPHYFSNWREMTILIEETDQYMEDLMNYFYGNSMDLVNKGVDMSFEKIRNDFRAIDFSGNIIYGKIPESVGFLKELRLLNLSGNAFTSDIPRSLANLTNLETLDLSRNKLSGQIPQDLGKLSFLSYMNFSHNFLQGPVPRDTQFQRQKCSSFLDNPRLYGLEDICGEPHVPNPTSQQPEELSEADEQVFNWIAAAIAYVPGVFCGLVIGHIFTSHNHEWFTKKFGRRKLKVISNAR